MTRLLLLTALLVSASLSHAQRMPVSTVSDAARAQFDLGVTALGHIEYERAAEHLEAAIAADPDFAVAHLYRAMASPEGRDEHLRLAAEGRASDAERQLIESYRAVLDGDRDQQIALLADLAARFPDDPVLWLRLANAYAAQGDATAAATVARRGLAADRFYAPLYNTLGYAELRRGNMLKADGAFRSYILRAPDEPNARDSYSEFLLAVGRLDLARIQYEMAIAMDPSFDPERRGLARIGIAMSNARFEQAVADGDADALASLFADGAVLMPPDAPPIQGRDAIREYLSGFVGSGADGLTIETVEVARFDDIAIERADLTVRMGEEVLDHGKSLAVWALVGDEWLYVRSMWSMNGAIAAVPSTPPALSSARARR